LGACSQKQASKQISKKFLIEPVPKSIILSQAFAVFRPLAYKTAFYKVVFPKSDILEKTSI
jgi:hypothetical protein